MAATSRATATDWVLAQFCPRIPNTERREQMRHDVGGGGSRGYSYCHNTPSACRHGKPSSGLTLERLDGAEICEHFTWPQVFELCAGGARQGTLL